MVIEIGSNFNPYLPALVDFVQEFVNNARLGSILLLGDAFNSLDDLGIKLVIPLNGVDSWTARARSLAAMSQLWLCIHYLT
jgi:hypothetical protein